MVEKPVFTRLPGDVVGMAPYRAEDALLQMVLLRGDRARQQDHCDATLNHPADGEVAYRVTSDTVLVTALYVGAMRSLDPIDGPKGKIREWDIAFWSPVVGGPTNAAPRQGWLPSFMFVDTAAAMASGREIYGYPKSHAVIEPTGAAADDAGVRVKTLHFEAFGADKEPAETPILTITRNGASIPEDLTGSPDPWADVGFETLAVSKDRPPPSPFSMPQITLRQTRDPVDMGRATRQSILETVPSGLKVASSGFLSGAHTVRLAPSASHPIVERLGLKTQNPALLGGGVWMRLEFTVGPSRAIWQSS